MSETYIPLTSDEQTALKKAAYGAVTLVSLAYPGAWSSAKENIVGAKVLTGATGIVGRILAGKDKFDIGGKTTADIADEVLAALRSTVTALAAKAPAETDEFRRVVTTAVQQAAASTRGGVNLAQADMIGKITNALGVA